jgi:hypothetical protein
MDVPYALLPTKSSYPMNIKFKRERMIGQFLLVVAIALLVSDTALAQTPPLSIKPQGGLAMLDPKKPLETPHIRTCVEVLKCEDGTNALTRQEREQLAEMLKVIKPGVTEAKISSVYELAPGSNSSPTQAIAQPQNTLVSLVTWYVAGQKNSAAIARNFSESHVSVSFVNNSAVKFRWNTDGMKKNVTVVLTE